MHIRIKIHLILIPNRIGLQKPPKLRIVNPRLVIIKPQLRQVHLPGVGKSYVGVGVARHAKGIVGVDAVDVAVEVAGGDDGALVVAVQVGRVEVGRAVGDEGDVAALAVEVADAGCCAAA